MAANSIAPSARGLDIYLDGADWKLDLWSADGATQINGGTVGTVEVATGGIVALPLDLRGLGGDAAHELRMHGAGSVKVRYSDPASSDSPVSSKTVVNGETIGAQIESIVSVTGVTRIGISWG